MLGLPRSTYYHAGLGESAENLHLMRLIDEQYLHTPFSGSRGLTVRLDRQPHQQPGQKAHKQVVTVSLQALQKAIREPGRDAISLAYAGTTHALQGAGVQTAYTLLGGQMTDRQMSYTQLTRGIEKTLVFCDALHAGEDLKDLARAMSRSREKRLAHDLARREKRKPDQRPMLEIRHELS